MSKREIAEFVPKGAPVKAIVDLVHSYMRGNMPLPDDFEDDRPEFDYEDDPDRMVYERGADLADESEIKGVEEARNQVPTVPGKLEIDAQDLGDDPRSYQDSARAVKTYLTRAGIKAKVTGDSSSGMIYIQLADPKQATKATKVIQDELGYEAVPSLDDSPARIDYDPDYKGPRWGEPTHDDSGPARIDYDPDYAGPRWGEQPFWKNK